MRLLTDYEVLEAGLIDPTYEKMHGRHCPPAWIRVAEKEHKETLKAVGEKLNKRHPNMSLTELGNHIDCLLRGEMPEEVK